MLITIRVTKTEAEQLLSYAEMRDRECWYYGRKDQFEKRHSSILEILRRVLEKATDY